MNEQQRWWLYLTMVYAFAFFAVFARASWRFMHLDADDAQRYAPFLENPLPYLTGQLESVLLDPWFWVMSFVLWGPWLIVTLATHNQLQRRLRELRYEKHNSND